jgi:hypothetical protein
MSRYRIVFRVEDALTGETLMRDTSVVFEASTSPIYDRLIDSLLVMAKIIKAALRPEVNNETARPQ